MAYDWMARFDEICEEARSRPPGQDPNWPYRRRIFRYSNGIAREKWVVTERATTVVSKWVNGEMVSQDVYVARDPRPKRADRPRCGAKCRDGHACQAPAWWEKGADKPRNNRCKMHGGSATGPRTEEGRRRVGEASRQRLLERYRARLAAKESQVTQDVTILPSSDRSVRDVQ